MNLHSVSTEIDGTKLSELGEFPMLNVKRILLCTDFSPSSNAALEAVVRLWNYTKSSVTVLHVCDFGPIPATTDEGIDSIEKLYAAENQKLRGVAQELRELGVQAHASSFDGNAVSIILEEIERVGFDLVALGTRGTRGIERLVFGSTAEGVFRKAGCPVMTVGTQFSAPSSSNDLPPVVFATDFHEDDNDALNYAAAMANRFGAPLHCIHVLPLLNEEDEPRIVEGIMTDALRRLTHDGAMCQLTPVYQVLYGSDVSHTVVEYAKREKAQAIVLGIRRKRRVAAHLPPQRTDRIIMTAPCPVFTLSTK